MSVNIVWIFMVSILATGAYCQDVIDPPENATVNDGDNITLKCVFSKNVTKCAWYRGSTGDTTNINGRYHYLDTNANGTNTSNCSIQITPFEKMDETKWHCSGLVGSEGSEGPKSNFAYLTMVKSNESSKQENHPTSSPTSSVTTTVAGPIFGLEKPYDILLMVGLGILATTFIFTLLMCYCRKATGKKIDSSNVESLPSGTNKTIPATSSRALLGSSKALNSSSESLCAFCHQQIPEVCTSGEVWSAPACKHLRDSRLPEHPTLEDLPPYIADQLYDDTGHPPSITKSPLHTSMDSDVSDPPTPVPVDYCTFVEDVQQKFPPANDSAAQSTPLSATSITTYNPVYGSVSVTDCKQDTRVFFPSSSSRPLPDHPMSNVQHDRPMSDTSDCGIYARIQFNAGSSTAGQDESAEEELTKPKVPKKMFK